MEMSRAFIRSVTFKYIMISISTHSERSLRLKELLFLRGFLFHVSNIAMVCKDDPSLNSISFTSVSLLIVGNH